MVFRISFIGTYCTVLKTFMAKLNASPIPTKSKVITERNALNVDMVDRHKNDGNKNLDKISCPRWEKPVHA